MSLFGSEQMNRMLAGGIKPATQQTNDFSNWTNKHREMNNLPAMPSKAPFDLPPKQPLPNKIPMSSGGLQPSQPPQLGMNRGGIGFNNPMPMPEIRPDNYMPPGLLELLQLFGSNQMFPMQPRRVV